MPYPPRTITHERETLTLAEWARRTNIPIGTIRSRIDQQGWSVADALGTPVKAKFNPRRVEPVAPPKPCPPLKTHSASGKAYCQWMVHGKEHWRYFGEAGTQEAADAYRRFQMEWAARGAPPPGGEELEVWELEERYGDYDQTGFVAFMRSDGAPLDAGTGPIKYLVHP